ncbi:MAG: general secretion pathway protein GspK [Gammaproteobacteria bacterium]|nr:general secretion pathway protein GspK [Gammaproteobacteria bacterium]
MKKMTDRFGSGARGMALIAVLWVVAALAILVSGFSRMARDEVGLVSSLRQSVLAQAAGDAAIALALQELAARPTPITKTVHAEFTYGGVRMPVTVMPLNGLVDINNASLALLARVYEVAGGLSNDAAQALAQSTVEVRSKVGASNQADRFEAVEDILRVPGVDYDLYARLSPLLTVYARAGGRVNPMAAPLQVLTVLANGEVSVASRIIQERDSGVEGIDTTALDPAFLSVSPGRRYRVEASVPLADGVRLRVVRTIDLGRNSRDGLPWRTLHNERSFEPLSRAVTR